MKQLNTALFALAFCLGGLVLANAEGERPEHVDRLLAECVQVEFRAHANDGAWKDPVVVRAADRVKALSEALAELPRYRGEPAGWVHSHRVDFVLRDGRRIRVHTMEPELQGRGGAFLSVSTPEGVQGGGERRASARLASLLIEPLREADAKRFGEDCAGRWEGRVLFADGQESRCVLELKPGKRDTWTGTYTLRSLGEEGLGAPRSGPVEGSSQGDGVVLRVAGEWFRGTFAAAGSHAERSLYGSFQSDRGAGVFMLYRYRAK